MKKTLIALSFALILAAVGFGIAGCTTNNSLQSGGVYSGDAFLYNADNTFANSYALVDSFVSWEASNNSWVKTNSPATFQLANTIRSKTPTVIADYAKARVAYVNYFSITNASLAQFQAASNALSAAVSEISSEASTTSVISTNITQ